jgi:hypothetical protein
MSFIRANPSLCESCRALFHVPQDDPRSRNVLNDDDDEGVKKLRVAWHRDTEALRISAESSCPLCVDSWHRFVAANWPAQQLPPFYWKPLACEISIRN